MPTSILLPNNTVVRPLVTRLYQNLHICITSRGTRDGDWFHYGQFLAHLSQSHGIAHRGRRTIYYDTARFHELSQGLPTAQKLIEKTL